MADLNIPLEFSILGLVYVFGLIFTAATATKKQGLWNNIFFGVLIPVFWPFALFYALCTQPRLDYFDP